MASAGSTVKRRPDDGTTRACTRCGETKPTNEFALRDGRPHGWCYRCLADSKRRREREVAAGLRKPRPRKGTPRTRERRPDDGVWKTCVRCGTEKPGNEFPLHRQRGREYLASWCYACFAQRNAERSRSIREGSHQFRHPIQLPDTLIPAPAEDTEGKSWPDLMTETFMDIEARLSAVREAPDLGAKARELSGLTGRAHQAETDLARINDQIVAASAELARIERTVCLLKSRRMWRLARALHHALAAAFER